MKIYTPFGQAFILIRFYPPYSSCDTT